MSQCVPRTIIVDPAPCADLAFCDRCNMRPCYCPVISNGAGGAVPMGRAWHGETKPDPAVIAEAIREEQARHAETCPRRTAYAMACNCMSYAP